MNKEIICEEINNPALRELAEQILDTVYAIKEGKKDRNTGLVELSGYKQVIQIMALEVMRKRLPASIH